MLTYLAIGLALQLLSSFWSICVRKRLKEVDTSDIDLGIWVWIILGYIASVAYMMVAWPIAIIGMVYIYIKQRKES